MKTFKLNKENEIYINKNPEMQEKKISHSEKLKRTIENKLCEMKNFENADLISEKKRDLEEKLKSYASNIRSLKMNNIGFSKSLILVSTLIKDLDDKMNKIRSIKSKRII